MAIVINGGANDDGKINYLSLLNNIIFTNVSSDNEKRGVLYLPKEISKKQLETLYGFALSVLDFDISVVYDMCRIDKMTVGEVFELDKQENLKEKLDDYVLKKVRLKYE